jgi:Ca2+/Na+ antiporter
MRRMNRIKRRQPEMPYLLLVLGLIFAAFTLYRFILESQAKDLRSLLHKIFLIFFAFILIFFSVTGRIRVAIFLVLLTIPFIIAHYRQKYKEGKTLPPPDDIIENECNQNDD